MFIKRLAKKIKRIIGYLFSFQIKKLLWEFQYPIIKMKTDRCNQQSAEIRSLSKNEKRALTRDVRNKRVIIFPPTFDWNLIMHQRPQQIAISYAQKKNTVVVFLTQNNEWDNIEHAEKKSERLWVVNKDYIDDVLNILKKARTVIMSLSWTLDKDYVEIISPDKLIYEYIDDLTLSASYGEKMEKDHQELLKRADVTVCTAECLYRNVLGIAKNPILSCNAGDYDFFSKTSYFDINPLVKHYIDKYDTVIGYYGAFAKWFDYKLVEDVATLHPDWLFILVGIDYDGTLQKAALSEKQNVLVFPPQQYTELPSFLKAFDIACIPFVINDITKATSPIKLYEYMAAGKPVITSQLPECMKFKSVFTYTTAESFCIQVEKIRNLKVDDPYWRVLYEEAIANTWDQRTDQILENL